MKPKIHHHFIRAYSWEDS